MAKKKDETVSSLASFSDIIRQQGEEKRLRDEAEIKKAEEDLPDWISKLPETDNEHLLFVYDTCLHGAYSNSRLMTILEQFKNAVKNEILKRMSK